MTVVSMCHISSAPLVRSATFGFNGRTRSRGRRQPYVRSRARLKPDAIYAPFTLNLEEMRNAPETALLWLSVSDILVGMSRRDEGLERLLDLDGFLLRSVAASGRRSSRSACRQTIPGRMESAIR